MHPVLLSLPYNLFYLYENFLISPKLVIQPTSKTIYTSPSFASSQLITPHHTTAVHITNTSQAPYPTSPPRCNTTRTLNTTTTPPPPTQQPPILRHTAASTHHTAARNTLPYFYTTAEPNTIPHHTQPHPSLPPPHPRQLRPGHIKDTHITPILLCIHGAEARPRNQIITECI